MSIRFLVLKGADRPLRPSVRGMGKMEGLFRRLGLSHERNIGDGCQPWFTLLVLDKVVLTALLDAITESYVLEIRPFLAGNRAGVLSGDPARR